MGVGQGSVNYTESLTKKRKCLYTLGTFRRVCNTKDNYLKIVYLEDMKQEKWLIQNSRDGVRIIYVPWVKNIYIVLNKRKRRITCQSNKQYKSTISTTSCM